MKPRPWITVATVAVLFISAAPADGEDAGKAFMWKAASGDATVYLLGTIHFSDPEMYPLDGAVEKAFAESDAVVMELAMSMQNQMKAAMLTLEKGMYADEETLSDHIAPETYAKLADHLKKRGIPLTMVNKMRPWLASVTLVLMEYAAAGFHPELGVDKYFYDRAVERGIPVWELETVEYQMEMFSAGGDEIQELALAETIEQLDKVDEFLREMKAAWLAGDPERLEAVMNEQMSDDERLKSHTERIIYERNDNMLEKIVKLFDREGTYFVMVGSAHLVGERGIPAQLEAKGYEITQVEKAGDAVEAAAVE